MKDMFEFEYHGSPDYRKTLDKPMPRAVREARGLGRWVPQVDCGGQDQGGHDTNFRGRMPKSKAQKTSATTWSEGTQTGYDASWWEGPR